MAKKRKVAKKAVRRRKPKSYMMVIRVAVPAKLVPELKVARVYGLSPTSHIHYDLEILNAFYDKPGQPNARL